MFNYDITYCTIDNCKSWNCEKKDTCRRYQQLKEIPEGVLCSMANLFTLCKDDNYSMYIKYTPKTM